MGRVSTQSFVGIMLLSALLAVFGSCICAFHPPTVVARFLRVLRSLFL